MITTGIIEVIEESEWVSPMVVQDKKAKGEIRIYVNLRKLIPFLHPLRMKCRIMWEEKKHILSLMDFQDTIKLEFTRMTGIRQCLQ